MPTILLVDDDSRLRAVFARALERVGYTVLTAGNGREALSVLQHLVPDLIITDLSMPELDGAALVRALRQNPLVAQVPVLLMSGNGSANVPAGYPLLHKPFPLQDLIAAVRRLV